MVIYKKFEEWSQAHKKNFILVFAKDYNETHETQFELVKDSLESEQDYDFLLRQKNGDILKVQHTFAGAEPEKEYVRPKDSEKVIADLREKTADLNNFFVYINFHNPPRKKEERIKLVFWLERIIRNKANELNLPFLFTYDRRDEDYLKNIKPYVDNLKISVNDSPGIVFGGQSWKLDDGPMLPDDIRINMALENKQKYPNPNDLIILIHYNRPFPFEASFLRKIRQKQGNSPFKGIWIYDDFRERFIKVK